MSTQVDWIATEVCDALPVLHHTYGYLPSHRTSPSPDQYQIILLADRGTCVWTTCPKSLPESVRPETHDLRSRKSNDITTMPHNTYRETVNSKCREKVLVTLRELYFSQCHGAWCLKCDKKQYHEHTYSIYFILWVLPSPCVPIIYAKGIYRAQNLKSSLSYCTEPWRKSNAKN